jgi:hypothetical protein
MSSFTLARVTIYSLLLALLLAAGIRLWNIGRRDACSAFLAGDIRAPASMYVVTGARTIVVPCSQWLPRQPLSIQILCLVDLIMLIVFVMNLLGDLRDWFGRRSAMRQSSP